LVATQVHGKLINAAQQCQPDVTIISVALEEGPTAGFNALKMIRMLHPNSPIIIVIDSGSLEVAVEGFRAGARGVIFRTEPVATLCKCIRAVHAGQVWASSSEMEQILEALRAATPRHGWVQRQGTVNPQAKPAGFSRSVSE
jgi:DNA-binding NarL/FixJ family response regulator